MTHLKAQGLLPDQLPHSIAARRRRSTFLWLRLEASDRHIAAFCAREAERGSRTAKRSAIERHATAVVNARERDASAGETDHVVS